MSKVQGKPFAMSRNQEIPFLKTQLSNPNPTFTDPPNETDFLKHPPSPQDPEPVAAKCYCLLDVKVSHNEKGDKRGPSNANFYISDPGKLILRGRSQSRPTRLLLT